MADGLATHPAHHPPGRGAMDQSMQTILCRMAGEIAIWKELVKSELNNLATSEVIRTCVHNLPNSARVEHYLV
jgi:hypothetical protein